MIMSEQRTISSSEGHSNDVELEKTSDNSRRRTENHGRCYHLNTASRQVVCLVDTTMNCNLIRSLEETSRHRVDDVKFFEDVDQCEDFLKQTYDTTTFLIISDQYEQSFVPQISQIIHIWSILICHRNPNMKHQQPQRSESQIGIIHTDHENLLTNLIQVIQQEINYVESIVFNNVTSTEEYGTTTDDSPCSSRIEFLDFLCYLPNPPDYFQRCLTFLKQHYEKNPSQLRHVENFAATYRAEDAIHWYTHDTFVYRLLNTALRRYDIKTLFIFSFLIKDIVKQLQKEHEEYIQRNEKKATVKIYRGQFMSPKEIEELKNKQSTPWLVNNSFFSATFNRNVALTFLNQSPLQTDDELQSVLFEIDINTEIKSRPYCDVSHLSQFQEEQEFIFSFGNYFIKTAAFYNNIEYVHIVQLQLNYDYHRKNDQEILSQNERIRLKKCVGLLEVAVEQISNENKRLIYDELITIYPTENEWLSALQMSWTASHCINEKDYGKALSYYNTALDIWHKFIDDEELNCSVDMARIHQRLARYYQYDSEEQTQAEKHFLESISYFKLALKKATSSYERMTIYEKLLYLEEHRRKLNGYDFDETEMVFRYEELSIANMLQYYRNDKVRLGQAFSRLADLRKAQCDYDESLTNYQRALSIFLELPSEFDFYLIISNIINNIVKIYIEEKNSDYFSAIQYELIRHKYISKHLKYIIKSQKDVRCINQCDLAQCKIELADKYFSIDKPENALIYVSEAIALYNDLGDTGIRDWKTIRHHQLQEKLADTAFQSQQYNKAREHIKFSIRCLEEQIHLLGIKVRLKRDDIVTRTNYRRERNNLEMRKQALEKKMNEMQQRLNEGADEEGEDNFEELCLSFNQHAIF